MKPLREIQQNSGRLGTLQLCKGLNILKSRRVTWPAQRETFYWLSCMVSVMHLASNVSYVVAIYLRMVTELYCPSPPLPISKQTIPRFELLGAVILSRLATCTKEVLEGSLVIDRLCQ